MGVSVDSHFSHLAWIETPREKGGLGGCGYPLVADITKSISSDFGVLIGERESREGTLGRGAGLFLRGVVFEGKRNEKKRKETHVLLLSLFKQSTDEGDNAGVALRGLFIISPTGVLRQITVNDLPVGRSVDETLRLVKAFQFTDEHGEVCPAGWEPGSKTIKPDVAGSKEYFEGVAATAGADDGNKKRKA